MKTKDIEEKPIKVVSGVSKGVIFAAMVACLMVGGAGSAFAVPAKQVSRTLSNQTFTGECCFLWKESVSVTEPAAVVPVIVTFTTDYSVVVAAEYHVGISLNGGQCTFYGSRVLADTEIHSGGTFLSAAFQWVILPGDGLMQGKNTFELCGGGASSSSDSIVIGENTLAVQIGK